MLKLATLTVAAILAQACGGRIVARTDVSPHYELHEISKSFLEYGRNGHLYVKSSDGRVEYLASVWDASASVGPFNAPGLGARNFAVSSDGRTIIYAHTAHLAGKRSRKPSGLYRYQIGSGESLVLPDSAFTVPAATITQRLPSDMLLIIRRGTGRRIDEVVSTDGDIRPIVLVGAGALHRAAFAGDTNEIARLTRVDPTGIDVLTHWNTTPLGLAVVSGHDAAALQLLSLGANRDAGAHPAILLAAAYGQTRVVDELLRRNAPITFVSERGETPFHAILGAPLDVSSYPRRALLPDTVLVLVRRFVAHGTHIDARDGSGRTLFHRVAALDMHSQMTSSGSLVEHLLRMGADPNAVDEQGNTALHYAAGALGVARASNAEWTARLPRFELITPRVANIDATNARGVSALQAAVQRNDVELADYLIARGATASVPFIHAGLGPEHRGETIQQRLDWLKQQAKRR